MPRVTRQCFVLCLCFLFLGVLIGILIDAAFRPNHMRFWVTEVNELAFAPLPGDKIDWFKVGTTKRMNIKFWGGDPCIPGSDNPCRIGDIPDTATYIYTCQDPDDPSHLCMDPQGGPKSGTNGFNLFAKLSDLLKNVAALLTQSFRPSLRQATSRATPPEASSDNLATTQTNAAQSSSAMAKTKAADSTIHAQIYCDDGGTTAVIVPLHNPNDPILANVGQQIQWGTSTGGGFTVTMTDASTCAEGMHPGTICTVKASGTYTANAPSCTTPTSPNETITAQ